MDETGVTISMLRAVFYGLDQQRVCNIQITSEGKISCEHSYESELTGWETIGRIDDNWMRAVWVG